MDVLNVGIIGAGLIGTKRAAHIKGSHLKAVADAIPEKAKILAQQYGAHAEAHWEILLKRTDIDIVIVATSNEYLVSCAKAALESGKHVLIEKPAGREPKEIEELLRLSQRSKSIARVGFNHRFHPGLQKMNTLIKKGAIGPLMYIRARYGHGGRIGYNKEWRANPAISGGGELLDQGVHLIDLCRWLGGEFELEWGKAHTFYWEMPVEDNGFIMLRSPDGKINAFLHASCTEWKNLFDFEVFGKVGKLQVGGLGRSYGQEGLQFYHMRPEMGPPDIQSFSFPEEDISWQLEFNAFLSEINGERSDIGTLDDAWKAVRIVHDVYASSFKG